MLFLKFETVSVLNGLNGEKNMMLEKRKQMWG